MNSACGVRSKEVGTEVGTGNWSVELGDGRLELRTVLGGCKWELGVWRWELEG